MTYDGWPDQDTDVAPQVSALLRAARQDVLEDARAQKVVSSALAVAAAGGVWLTASQAAAWTAKKLVTWTGLSITGATLTVTTWLAVEAVRSPAPAARPVPVAVAPRVSSARSETTVPMEAPVWVWSHADARHDERVSDPRDSSAARAGRERVSLPAPPQEHRRPRRSHPKTQVSSEALPAALPPVTELQRREEFERFQEARRAIETSPTTTLELLRRLDLDLREGLLGEERAALRIEALARVGELPKAWSLYESFQERHPKSPLRHTLEAILEGAGAGSR